MYVFSVGPMHIMGDLCVSIIAGLSAEKKQTPPPFTNNNIVITNQDSALLLRILFISIVLRKCVYHVITCVCNI